MPRKKKNPLTTKEGLIGRLEEIANDAEVKTPDQIRAIKQLGDLRGFNVDKVYRNLERLPPEDLLEKMRQVREAVRKFMRAEEDIELSGFSVKKAQDILSRHGEACKAPGDPGADSSGM